jgi:hypothetical protein
MNYNLIKDKLKSKAVEISLESYGSIVNVTMTSRSVNIEMSDGKRHAYSLHFLLCCVIASEVSDVSICSQYCYTVIDTYYSKKIYDDIMLHKSYSSCDELINEIKQILEPTLIARIKQALFWH